MRTHSDTEATARSGDETLTERKEERLDGFGRFRGWDRAPELRIMRRNRRVGGRRAGGRAESSAGLDSMPARVLCVGGWKISGPRAPDLSAPLDDGWWVEDWGGGPTKGVVTLSFLTWKGLKREIRSGKASLS